MSSQRTQRRLAADDYRRLCDHYTRLRAEYPTVPAKWALDWARDAVKVDAITTKINWQAGERSSVLAIGEMPDFLIRVYVDDEPYDWGDCEPTDDERERLEVIGVGVRIDGDDDDLNAIWSVGYLHGDYEREAIETAVTYGFVDLARAENAERERTRGYVETV